MSAQTLFGLVCLQVLLGLTSAQCQDQECLVCSVVADRLINSVSTEAVQLDSCSYSLISSAAISDLQVQVVLKPRRHLSLKFVDEVKVIYGDATVELRGGRATISRGDIGSELSSGSVEVVSGLTVSRDDKFTTVDLQQGALSLRLQYNGVSTHLRLTGPKGQDLALDGLCKSKAAPTDYKDQCEPEYEDPQEPQFEDQKDSLCSPLDSLESPLASQMKSLCRSVLKVTGDSDALPCALLLAYNTHSSLLGDRELLQLTCNLDLLKSCVTRVCGSVEFCGQKEAESTDSACFCLASVSASFSATGQIGALECDVTDATLSIPNCYLREKDIDHTQLHLGDSSCKGVLQPETQQLVFQSSEDQTCGAMLKTVDGSMKYKNEVVMASSGAVVADMSCPFAVPEISVDFDVSVTVLEDPDSPGPIEYSSSSLGSYSAEMKAFLDKGHAQPIDAHMKLRLNTPVYFQIQIHGLDHLRPALVLDSCWATNQRDAEKEPKYYLIKDRCPADQWVVLVRSGVGIDAELMFRIFQFVGHDSDIFLHCVLKLCLPEEGACEPECGESNRRRRSSAPHYAASFSVDALTWK